VRPVPAPAGMAAPQGLVRPNREPALEQPDQRIPLPAEAFIPRQRLADALDEATTRPLTVLVAPAGSGKTSTLAHWATTVDRPIRWLSLPPEDTQDPTTLLHEVLVAAARKDDPADEPDVVVVDDAQQLPATGWSLVERWLATEPPDRVRLVLASRRDVPLGLVALELSGGVTVLRADALRFTDHEALALVSVHAPDVDPGDAGALQLLAQGWAAALVLGARTLAAAPDRARAREALAHTERPVLDYLLSEVFTTLPAATRHVLLCTADAEYVTDVEAIILSGDPDAPSRLAYLARDGMLVTTYSSGPGRNRRWHYHPLLHEALRRQVAADGPDHSLAIAAHGRSALHHATHGPVLDAVRQATRAAMPDLLATLLTAEGPGLVVAGHEQVVTEALGVLPARVTDLHPALVGVAAIAHRGRGDTETAAMLAARAVRAAKAVRRRLSEGGEAQRAASDGDIALLADAALLEAWQSRFGWTDIATAIRHAREVLGCQHADEMTGGQAGGPPTHTAHQPPWPVSASRIPWLLNELSAAELWTNQFALAEAHNAEALVAAQALGQHRTVAGAQANRALIEMFSGRTQSAMEASHACRRAAQWSGRSDDSLLARAEVVAAWVAYSEVEYARALESLDEVDRISARASDPLVAILAQVLRARILADVGDVDQARRVVSSAPLVPDSMPSYLVRLLTLFRAQWALLDGDAREAREHADTMLADGWEAGSILVGAICHDIDGDAAEAARRLETLLEVPPGFAQTVPAAVAAAYKLRMLLRDGNSTAVPGALRDVLNRVAPQRMVGALVFTGEDRALEEALRQESAAESPHPFVDEALAAVRRHASYLAEVGTPDRPHGAAPAPRDGVEDLPPGDRTPARTPSAVVLTERESDVLRELALGGSYVDIARALYITENTVKTHIASLYRKLGAERRAHALRRARQIGLL
jgi:LuxR family maltose regulon positive regulatory protein